MKSVFSAFKGRKSDSSGGSGGSGGNSNNSNNTGISKSVHNKGQINYNENSYASLRQIREADPCIVKFDSSGFKPSAKMSIANGDESIVTTTISADIKSVPFEVDNTPDGHRLVGMVEVGTIDSGGGHERQQMPLSNICNGCNEATHSELSSSALNCRQEPIGADEDAAESDNKESNEPIEDVAISHSIHNSFGSAGGLIGDSVRSLPPTKPTANVDADDSAGSSNGGCGATRMPVLSGDINRSLKSGDLNALRNKNNNIRLGKRLSLTGLGNNLLPTVHGRAKNVAEKTKTRFSHQRNLSLDFR